MPFDPKLIDLFPSSPGVYLMKNQEGTIIYIGKAKALKQRVKQYFASKGDTRAMIPFLLAEIESIETILVRSEKEALLVENTLIKKHKPKYNAVLKDDKSFISLMINHKHPWPMLKLIRYKGKPKENGLYFGPYTSAFSARETYDLLSNLFPLRQCSDDELKKRTRPCLLYGIKRCLAPCVQLCQQEEYNHYVDGVIKFLKGQDKDILLKLYQQMEEASEALEFEKAATLLRTIRQVEHVLQSHQVVFKTSGKDADVLSIYREGDEVVLVILFFRDGKLTGSDHFSFSNLLQEDDEIFSSFILQNYKNPSQIPAEILVPMLLKDQQALEEVLSEEKQKKVTLHCPIKGEKYSLIQMAEENAKAAFIQNKNQQELKEKLLLDLQDQLHLTRYPKHIECFDTSNIAGSDQVACMITFDNGERNRKRTRYFHMKGMSKGDDYGAMRQALHRHLTKSKQEEILPDLIIVDGGKGQLSVAMEVCKELDIANMDVIALAKEQSRHDKGMTLERVFVPHTAEPIQLAARSQLLFFLQNIRDTAHEKVLSFHQKSRSKRTIHSALETISGIGPVKRKRLLTHFGSIKKILEASDEELSSVKGISGKDIRALREYSLQKPPSPAHS